MQYLRKLDIKLVEGDYHNPIHGQVREASQVYDVFKDIKEEYRELLIGVYLNDKLEALSYDVLSIGGEESTMCIPHEIFRRIILVRGKYFILVHNHPKGDPRPSTSDNEIIQHLVEQSKVVKLKMLDFIIVGGLGKETKPAYWSWFEEAEGGEYPLGALS